MSLKMKKILAILSLVLIMSITLFSIGIAYKGGVRGVGLVGVMFFFTFRGHCRPGSIDPSRYPPLLFYRNRYFSDEEV